MLSGNIFKLYLSYMQQLSPTVQKILAGVVAVVIVAVVGLVGFSVLYAGKVLPGVTVNGVYAGGLNKSKAIGAVQAEAKNYDSQQIAVTYNKTTLRVPVSALQVKYSEGAVDAALAYGRTGPLSEQIKTRLRSLFGRPTTISRFSYTDANLTPFLNQVSDDVTAPVANASLNFSDGTVKVTASQPGKRVDIGQLTILINSQIASMDNGTITAPIYLITPSIDEDTLAAAKDQAATFVSTPLTATAQAVSKTIDQATILSWIDVSATGYRTDMAGNQMVSFYDPPNQDVVKLTVSKPKVQVFVGQLAKQVNREPHNAGLSMNGGKLVVETPSKDGLKVDEAKAGDLVIAALNKSDSAERTVALPTANTKADVNEGNLDTLGLKELVSEGNSSFPGSSAARMTNVRVAQALYDGVLIKPGQVFSFGEVLGDVGPAQGYLPSLVIIGTKEEKQYGGGICQVSSTLYRAALNAGLPIVQRTNHAFVINEFYTQPYGVPGVDATIYYPQVDLKFKNDTPGYLLIQTSMVGTTLKFSLYGTKTKTGVVRGPYFVTGDADATKPSQTVFYRDVVDLSGKVIRTDTTNTFYKASTDFTVVNTPQFN